MRNFSTFSDNSIIGLCTLILKTGREWLLVESLKVTDLKAKSNNQRTMSCSKGSKDSEKVRGRQNFLEI